MRVYQPRILPRTASDVIYGLFMGVPAGLAMLGLPFFVVAWFELPPVLIL